MQSSYDLSVKRGYLEEDYRIFHIKDKKDMEFEPHYHNFNKIIITISGNVTYLIEGKAYRLKPWDTLLIGGNEVHKVIVNSDEVYERVIIWINSSFLEEHSSIECKLMSCFEEVQRRKNNLLRLPYGFLEDFRHILSRLEGVQQDKKFGSKILGNAIFMQLMVQINRLILENSIIESSEDIIYDETVVEILEYINKNLNEELSIDAIASKYYISRYYLMHKFKQQTGYTLYNYVLQKRLIMAKALLKTNMPLYEICTECGFNDYSSFVKAFKKMFGTSPGKYTL